jgi:hypothetical protein
VSATGAATFNSKDVATANLVTVNSTTLADGTGGLASNYSLAAGETVAASITKAALTVTVAAPNKVYNGNTTAAPTLTITGGLVTGETVNATGAATFNSKDVATANLVTVNSATLADGTGGLASNYNLAAGETVAASITKAALTATVAAPNKVYNGNTTSAPTLTITGGLVTGETVSATGAATFNSKDVATANLVTVNSTTLTDGTGGLAGNYSLGAGETVAASITAANLSVAGVTAANKLYDATTVASLGGTATVSAFGTDVVTVGGIGSGIFSNKNIGLDKAVTVSGFTLGGTDSGNYRVVQPANVTATITAKSLSVSGITANDKVYDATNAATVSTTGASFNGLIAGDILNVGATGIFADREPGVGKTVNLASSYTGADFGNYIITSQNTATASIAALPVKPETPPTSTAGVTPVTPVTTTEASVTTTPAPVPPTVVPPSNTATTGTTTVLQSMFGTTGGNSGGSTNTNTGSTRTQVADAGTNINSLPPTGAGNAGADPAGPGSGNGFGAPGNGPANNPRVVVDVSLVSNGTVLPMQIVNGGVNLPASSTTLSE